MYLKVTDAHLATACMVPTVQKVVSNVVPDMAVIEGHERSTGSQTLEKPSFPVIASHAMSGVCSQVGDEGLEASSRSPYKTWVLRPFSFTRGTVCGTN